MKKHIALLLSAVMCLGMLAGCGSGKTAETTNTPAASTTTEAPATETAAPATETPAAQTPATEATASKEVEVLRIGTTASISGANIMTESGIFGKLNYNAVVTAPFVVTDASGKVQPFFMTDWELSDDLNTLKATFATDQGILWHDGEPVTMDDVKFTFENIIERKSGYCPGLVSIEVTGDNTATLTFEEGKAFTTINSMANFVPVRPAHIWKDMPDQKTRTEYLARIVSIISMQSPLYSSVIRGVSDKNSDGRPNASK